MTYPPGSPGYPPAQQPTNQFSAPTQQFGKVPEQAPSAGEGASKLPVYLAAAVAALGLAVYLSSFAPLFTISASDFPGLGSISGSSFGLVLAMSAALLAGLFAGVSLLPRQRVATAVIAALAVAAFLLVIAEVINKPSGASLGWGLYLLIAFTLIQAILAVAVLLFESGVITPPAPRPKYEQQQHYGQYGAPGQYYGQQQGQLGQHHGGAQPGQPQQQRPGYPSTYPGGYQQGPSTGGYPPAQQSGPPTPPTGFPTYGQPPSSTAPTTQVPAQPSPSSQSGQNPS